MILNKTILVVCLFSFAASAFSSSEISQSRFYVGANSQVRYMGFHKKFGDSIMRKVHQQGNIFVGFNLTDNLAIELAREVVLAKSNNVTLTEGQIFNGVPIPKELSPSEFMTKMKAKCLNLDLVLYQQIFDEIPLFFAYSIDVSHLTINISRDTLSCGNYTKKIPCRKMNKSFLALKPSTALQYDFENGLSLRTSISFVNTNGKKISSKDAASLKLKNKPRVYLKDSFVFGVGLILNI